MYLGFATANFAARAARYDGVDDLDHHIRRTIERFHIANMDAWLGLVAEVGFQGTSLWTAHAWPSAVSPEQGAAISSLANRHEIPIYSYDGTLPPSEATLEHSWERLFRLAQHCGAGWITGDFHTRAALPWIRHWSRQTGVKFAYVNGPESRTGEIRERIADYEDCVGVAFDTINAHAAGMDVAASAAKLSNVLLEVRLGDLRKYGRPGTCALGDGRLPIRDVVKALFAKDWQGYLTVIHQPLDRDPMPEIELSARRLREWLSALQDNAAAAAARRLAAEKVAAEAAANPAVDPENGPVAGAYVAGTAEADNADDDDDEVTKPAADPEDFDIDSPAWPE